MKILIVHNSYQIRGGEDVVVENEIQLLRDHGHDVREYRVSNEGIKSVSDRIEVAWSCAYSESAKKRFEGFVGSWIPDVCHVHNLFPLITFSVFDSLREMGVPIVQTLHNYRTFCANGLFLREGKPCELCLSGNILPALMHRCYRKSFWATLPVAKMIYQQRKREILNEKTDTVIALTEFARNLFIRGGLQKEKIFVKYHSSPDLLKTRKPGRLGYGIYLGRLSEEKGVKTLLRFWPDHLSLKLVGDGPLLSFARDFAGSHPNIEVLGALDRQSSLDVLAGADFLVCPTECYEGAFPMVLIEAMSMGIPVLASRIGGIPEILEHEKNALLFEPANGESMLNAVNKFSSNQDQFVALRTAGRQTYERYFQEQANYGNLLKIYQQVIANNPKQ